MSDLVDFRASHVEIHDGVVVASSIEGWPDPEHVGEYRFYVVLSDVDGGFMETWDGDSYECAILEAESLGLDFGVPVLDLIQGRPA